ncbi:hypothetical protein HRbin02_01965 [Candidatus Calditenuaceae archaeon HR02]|nr:hypothetical protein HRbin02_01965 [Candidatus Calditenuaceae archaeon HR02]
MTLVIKKIDSEKVRLFKAEAVKRGLLLHQALEEAITLWLNASSSAVETDFEVNNRVYEAMKEELRKKHTGKFVVVAEGRLVGVFDEKKEALEALHSLGNNINHAILTQIGVDEGRRGELEWWGGSIELQNAQGT